MRVARRHAARHLSRECWRLFAGSGPYAGSTEELTPVRLDWISAVPLAMIAIAAAGRAEARGQRWRRGGWGAHLLDLGSIRRIESEDFSDRHSGSSSLP